MKRLLLLVMLLLLGGVLLGITDIYAATENSTTSENLTNSSLVQENLNSSENATNIQIITGNSYNSSGVPVETYSEEILQQLDTNDSSTNNKNITFSDENTEDIQDSQQAAGSETYTSVHGIWLKAEDINDVNVAELKKGGITDIFIKTNLVTNPTYSTVLTTILDKLKDSGIRVHAWITCFKDATGNWVDPQGKYNYTVSIPYTQIAKVPYKIGYKGWYKKAYKAKVKKWYKSGGKWKYYWVYQTRYKKVYGWTYKLAYKTTTQTKYKYETKTEYSTTYIDGLINSISEIVHKYNIDGIHLDYIRYSGAGDNAAYKNPGGTESITSFVQRVHDAVKSIKSKVAISAALMPECGENAKYYGQDYSKLSQYLDFLVPMIYKGNYGYNSSTGTNSKDQDGADWIGSTVQYIVSKADGKPVIAGLQTYRSDSDIKEIPANELNSDIKAAADNGAAGYALFRYGLIDEAFFNNAGTLDPVKFTISQIKTASESVKSFIESNQRLPNYVEIRTKQVSMPEFLRILTTSILEINQGITTPITQQNTGSPIDSTGDLINGTINKTEYLDTAQRIKSFIDSNDITPNYATSSLGKIQYESLVYMYSKLMDFYNTNNRLPNYVTMTPWKDVSTSPEIQVPDNLKPYLLATANCQVNDPHIKSLASSITQGATTTYEKATKIFNWVRDNLEYSFYYNTKYGAVNTYLNKKGNCVDHSHLLIALARAAGIPARYRHGTCTFNSGNVYGHVWTQLWVNGKWYDADAISSKNTFGNINNWDESTVIMKGTYLELPF